MIDLAKIAKQAIADAEARKSNAIKSLDPMWDEDKIRDIESRDATKALVEVSAKDLKDFLLANRPTDKSAEKHAALTKGAKVAEKAPKPICYVQASCLLVVANNSIKVTSEEIQRQSEPRVAD